jgi:hypothetical protein
MLIFIQNLNAKCYIFYNVLIYPWETCMATQIVVGAYFEFNWATIISNYWGNELQVWCLYSMSLSCPNILMNCLCREFACCLSVTELEQRRWKGEFFPSTNDFCIFDVILCHTRSKCIVVGTFLFKFGSNMLSGDVRARANLLVIFFTIGFQLVMVKPLLIKIFDFPKYP